MYRPVCTVERQRLARAIRSRGAGEVGVGLRSETGCPQVTLTGRIRDTKSITSDAHEGDDVDVLVASDRSERGRCLQAT